MSSDRRQLYTQIERDIQRAQKIKHGLLLIGLASLLLFMLSACTFASGNGNKWTVAALGSDITMMDITGTGFKADKIDNSKAFIEVSKQVRNMWQSYLALQGLEFIGGKYFDKAGQEIASSQTIKLEELRNAKDLELANLKLEELKLLEAAPAP